MECDSVKTVVERDRCVVWHPYTIGKKQSITPIIKGKGSHLFGEDGKAYIDAISSWWVNIHGHAHPYIKEKIKAQMDNLEHVLFAGFTHIPAVDLAEKLLQILPKSMSKVFYSDNGSTAVEVALKIAIQYFKNGNSKTAKKKVVCFRNSYHGDTFGAMAVAGKGIFNKPFWSYLFEVEMIDPPLVGSEQRSAIQLQEIVQREDVACFIYEPVVLAAGGMIIYPETGLKNLLEICRRHDVITIADEVMTGFGRTGALFVSLEEGLQPDIICLSKGITGGFLPLGATVVVEKIFQSFASEDPAHAFLHGHSYTANPLSCAAAVASMDLLVTTECANNRSRIECLHQEFCDKWRGAKSLKRVEAKGTLLVVEYAVDNPSYFSSLSVTISSYFLSKGIVVRPLGNVLYILPPYCITDDELHTIYGVISSTL